MTASQLAGFFGSKFRGNSRTCRAKCPVHKSRGLSLMITAGRDRVTIICHAGCHSDDVMAAVGLKWQDMIYEQKPLDTEAYREYHKQRRIKELYQREQRMQALRLWLESLESPPQTRTKDKFERDLEAFEPVQC